MSALTYSAIDVCGAQFNRLACDGSVLNGPSDVVLTCGLVDITRTPITGDDRTVSDANGSGGFCAKRVQDATIEAYEIKITLCSITDGDLMELLGIYDPVIDPITGMTIGVGPIASEEACYCAPAVAGCTNPGVSIVVWSVAWCGEDRRLDMPFVVEEFPRVVFQPSSLEVTRNSSFNTYTLTGRTKKNAAWGQGPGSIYPELSGIGSKDWAEHLTTIPFPGGCNCGVCDSLAGYASAATALGN